MTTTVVDIHPTRRCSNCAHIDAEYECLQLVSMADGSAKPDGFACVEHQTATEYRVELHRPDRAVLEVA